MAKIATTDLKTKRATLKKELAKLKNKKLREDKIKKLKEVVQSEKNMTRMIVFQLIICIICRLPEVGFYLHFAIMDENHEFYNDWNYVKLCTVYICPVIINIIQFFYMLSYLTNILFYYLFNKTFKKGFKYFFTRNMNHLKEDIIN